MASGVVGNKSEISGRNHQSLLLLMMIQKRLEIQILMLRSINDVDCATVDDILIMEQEINFPNLSSRILVVQNVGVPMLNIDD